ncbi:MAG: RNA polymerase sigma factor [Ruminiclostridium sp.]
MHFKTKDKEYKKIEELYIEYRTMMYRIAYSILNDNVFSEDAVQQAFETIIINYDKFKNLTENRTKGLLILITKNTCLNILKRKKIIEFVSFDDEMDDSCIDNPIENFIISNESYSRLLKVIDDLDEKYSLVLQLKFVFGYTYSEISKLLSISDQVVRVRIYRAKKKIIECLKSEGLNYE